MPEETNAAVGLEQSIKEAISPTGGDAEFEDVLGELEEAVVQDESRDIPVKDPEAKEEPKAEEKEEPAKDEPAKDEKESKVPDEDWDDAIEDKEDEEASEEKEESPPEDATEATKENWKRLTESKKQVSSELKEVSKARADLEARNSELQEQISELEELKSRKEQYDVAQKELALTRVEATDEYKQTISVPLKNVEDQMVAIVQAAAKQGAEVSVDKVFSALEKQDPIERRVALKEAMADMDAVDQADIQNLSRDAFSLLQKREEIHTEAESAAVELKATREAREATDRRKAKEEFQKAKDTVLGEFKRRVEWSEEEGQPTKDDLFDVVAKELERFSQEELATDTDIQAKALASWRLLPKLNAQLKEVLEENAKLKNRVGRKRTRKATVHSSDPASVSDSDDYSDLDIDEQIAMAEGLERSRTIVDILAEEG